MPVTQGDIRGDSSVGTTAEADGISRTDASIYDPSVTAGLLNGLVQWLKLSG